MQPLFDVDTSNKILLLLLLIYIGTFLPISFRKRVNG